MESGRSTQALEVEEEADLIERKMALPQVFALAHAGAASITRGILKSLPWKKPRE